MKKVCWIVPVTSGKTDKAREYCEALETTRRAEYEKSEQEIGITREVFFLWRSPDGRDCIVLYMEGDDLTAALTAWVDHQGDFETWGKAQWAEFSDPADWPQPLWASPGESGLPELLSAYDAVLAPSLITEPARRRGSPSANMLADGGPRPHLCTASDNARRARSAESEPPCNSTS